MDWLTIILKTVAERMHTVKKDPREVARQELLGKAVLWLVGGLISLLLTGIFPLFLFLAIYMFYKSYKTFKIQRNDEALEQYARKVAHQVYKHYDYEFKKNPDYISSFPNRKGAEIKYTTLKEAKKIYNGDVYVGHFMLSKAMLEIATDDIKEKAEKTPLFLKSLELTKGLVVLGKMGSGKSVLLKNLLAQNFYNRAVVNDVKGEYVSSFYRDGIDIIYNIFDERSKLWDIFGDIHKNPALAQGIAEAIVETSSQQKDFWLPAAVTLLKDALLHATFAASQNKYTEMVNYIENYRQKAVEEEDKTAMSVYATLQPILETFKILAWLESQNVEKFSLYNFVESKDTKLFLLLDPAHEKAMRPLTNALLTALISILLSRPDTKEDFTLFLLDEFLSIRIPENIQTQLFTLARSKGIQLITAAQYLTKDNEKLIQNVMNSRQYLAIFPIADTYTLEILEKAGESEARYLDTTPSFSSSYTRSDFFSFFKDPQSFTTTTANYSQRVEKEQFKIFSTKMLYQLPEYSFILTSTDPFSFLASKVKEFYFDLKATKNPHFVERNLSKYYEQLYSLSN